jgi:hypothetical protein
MIKELYLLPAYHPHFPDLLPVSICPSAFQLQFFFLDFLSFSYPHELVHFENNLHFIFSGLRREKQLEMCVQFSIFLPSPSLPHSISGQF